MEHLRTARPQRAEASWVVRTMVRRGRGAGLVLGALAPSCSKAPSPDPVPPPSSSPFAQVPMCGGGRRMTIHFYDVGQALAALVDLPDGRHILVDAGDSPRRPGCGEPCVSADRHLLERLRSDLHDAPIDLLWITHQHSDHIGGAPEVLETFKVA